MRAVSFVCGLALLLVAASRLLHRRTWATVFALALGIGQAASATTSYPSYFGPSMSFTGIQETTTTSGDPEPLFGAPTGSGDQLLFSPTNFRASVSGTAFHKTGSRLETLITATSPGATIDILKISESGTMSGDFTNGSSFLGVSMAGTVTVLEVNGSAITPYAINFSSTDHFFSSAVANVASFVPNATKVMLSFENDLYANVFGGDSGTVQKNAVVIQVIPEPSTAVLVGIGLLALGAVRRSSRPRGADARSLRLLG